MSEFAISKLIYAPLARVFSLFSDFAQAPQRVRGIVRIEMLTPGPIALGSRFRETRIMFGREASEVMEICAWAPDRHYTIGCTSCGCRIETTFRFQVEESRTRVDVSLVARPLTFAAKLMSPMTAIMMGPLMRKCVEQDVEDLRTIAESDAAAAR